MRYAFCGNRTHESDIVFRKLWLNQFSYSEDFHRINESNSFYAINL